MIGLLAKLLRIASIVICLIVSLSFIVFAANQTKSASGHQREELGESSAQINHGSSTTKESSIHRKLDEVSNEFTSPFSGIVTSSSEWLNRGVLLILSLLVYGFGLGFLARFLRVRA